MNVFDVFLEALLKVFDNMARPPFSYLILIGVFITCIFSVARIVLRLVDLGSVEHDDEDKDECDLSDDVEDNIDWYISADDFTSDDREDD